jgi:MoxR-like ATPase
MWGPPGIGKSEVVAEVTEELGGFMIDLRMAQMEPTDIRGIPYFNKDINKMDWAAPVDLPDEELASKYPIVVLVLGRNEQCITCSAGSRLSVDFESPCR